MDKIKHTRGPWSESREVENHGTFWRARVNSADGGAVCFVTSEGVHGPDRKAEMYANQKLISAAPDLLQALKTLSEYSALALTELTDQNTGWFY